MEEVAEVLEEMDGPGVVGGEEGMSGGVTERERCSVAMLMVGRACQKDEVEVVVGVARGGGGGRLVEDEARGGSASGVALELATGVGLSAGLAGSLPRFLSFSRSFLSYVVVLSSTWVFAKDLKYLRIYEHTPKPFLRLYHVSLLSLISIHDSTLSTTCQVTQVIWVIMA